MKKLLTVIFLLILFVSCKQEATQTVSEETEKQEILSVMKAQEEAWSNHDLEGFMQGYWKSDSLKFFGRNGITFGWQKTLDNYKKGYPTKGHSGTLTFKINDISKITDGAYSVMGEYHLKRNVGDANGVFMIVFKKIQGEWKIIADTSC
ncbi:nuclear transport factor 2 family protein [Tenacibaculum sp. 1B UA]|uniref:YybH family protein n=1 Tax=Tenacibaculum sp. 1B UA TaxID=2922252 RepID=UPI002A23FD92|nr:nuclear transport factor 2 family protein [Tenacibaculum sp. 1B UA]MDX8552671.1 nuclear transport factor 2 family protein [Tenacibaculum sp. 1B UA]